MDARFNLKDMVYFLWKKKLWLIFIVVLMMVGGALYATKNVEIEHIYGMQQLTIVNNPFNLEENIPEEMLERRFKEVGGQMSQILAKFTILEKIAQDENLPEEFKVKTDGNFDARKTTKLIESNIKIGYSMDNSFAYLDVQGETEETCFTLIELYWQYATEEVKGYFPQATLEPFSTRITEEPVISEGGSIIKQTVLFGIAGGVLWGILVVFFYLVGDYVSIYSVYERYDLPIIGILSKTSINKAQMLLEQKRFEANIKAMRKNDQVAVISVSRTIKPWVEKMLKENGIVLLNSPQRSVDYMETLSSYSSVLCLVDHLETRCEDLEQTMMWIDAYKDKIKGVLILKG